MNKDAIRAAMKQKRRGLTEQERQCKSAAIGERLFRMAQYRHARTVMVYLSAFGEVETTGIMEHAFAAGKKVVVPVSIRESHTIRPSYIASAAELAPGAYGIPEPAVIAPAHMDALDLILVPGLAFDRRGGRIGFGKGYYDRFLEQVRAPKIALAYSFQIISDVHAQAHDVKMDYIITEGELVCCE